LHDQIFQTKYISYVYETSRTVLYLDVKGRQAASCIWDITVHWHCFGSDWCHFLYF